MLDQQPDNCKIYSGVTVLNIPSKPDNQTRGKLKLNTAVHDMIFKNLKEDEQEGSKRCRANAEISSL